VKAEAMNMQREPYCLRGMLPNHALSGKSAPTPAEAHVISRTAARAGGGTGAQR